MTDGVTVTEGVIVTGDVIVMEGSGEDVTVTEDVTGMGVTVTLDEEDVEGFGGFEDDLARVCMMENGLMDESTGSTCILDLAEDLEEEDEKE